MPEGTLVLAEDDLVLRQLYSSTLRAEGYTVLAVSNGREALDLICCATPRLVVLDINIPEINGIEVCRKMRNVLGDELPILFLTVSDSIDVLLDCFKAGCNDFIIKTDNLASIIVRIGFWANRVTVIQRNLQRPQILATLAEQVSSRRQPTQQRDIENLNEVPPRLHKFLTSARTLARTDYGSGLEQQRLFLGYVIGALDSMLAKDLSRKPYFWTLLTECLRPTGALENAQIQAMLDRWEQTCQDELLLSGINTAREDWRNNQETPPRPPTGLATLLSAFS